MRPAVLCCLFALPLSAQPPAGKGRPKHDPGKAEAAVRAWVHAFPTDRDSIKFLKWGPHDLGAKAGIRHGKIFGGVIIPPRRFTSKDEPLPLVRCRWQMLNERGVVQVYDMICGVHEGAAVFMIPNPHGDRWVSEMGKEAKAKE